MNSYKKNNDCGTPLDDAINFANDIAITSLIARNAPYDEKKLLIDRDIFTPQTRSLIWKKKRKFIEQHIMSEKNNKQSYLHLWPQELREYFINFFAGFCPAQIPPNKKKKTKNYIQLKSIT